MVICFNRQEGKEGKGKRKEGNLYKSREKVEIRLYCIFNSMGMEERKGVNIIGGVYELLTEK